MRLREGVGEGAQPQPLTPATEPEEREGPVRPGPSRIPPRSSAGCGAVESPRVDQVFDYARSELGRIAVVPGAAVGIVNGEDERCEAFGVTSVEHPLDVTGETLFQIGSITKTITGTVAMRLVEQGKLDLETPVRTYLPELRMSDAAVADRVTMRHLLTHTGGWVGDFFDDLGYGDDALARMVDLVAELPQLTPLGEIWSYNNSGFYLAGRVIEVVTGSAYEAAVQEYVLDPVGMSRSFFFAGDVMTHRFAVGHEVDGDEVRVARPWPLPRPVHPAGGLTSSVGDLLRYARFHIGEGPQLLTPASLESMRTPYASLGGLAADDIGLTWMLRERDGRRIVSHGGATNGQQALLALVPQERFAVAVLTNSSRGGELCANVVREALRELVGIEAPDPEPLTLAADEVAEYLGLYSAPLTDAELVADDGSLTLKMIPKGGFPKPDSPPFPAPPPAPVAFYDRDKVFVPEGPMAGARGDFIRDGDGRIVWLRIGARVHARQ